jgi:membrane protein DedA with SNARE-associated domain
MKTRFSLRKSSRPRWALFLVLLLSSIVAGTEPTVQATSTEASSLSQSVAGSVVEHLDTGISKIRPFLDRYGYAALFISIFVEGFIIPAPGQSLLIAASLDSAYGHLNILWVLLTALVAAVSGNAVGYLIGRWGGRALLARIRVNEARLLKVERYFERRGAVVLLFARFLDGFRQLNAVVAGMLEMSWRRFMALSTAGAVLWTGVWGLAVYLLDRRVAMLHVRFHLVQPIAIAIAIASVAAILLYLVRRRRIEKQTGT